MKSGNMGSETGIGAREGYRRHSWQWKCWHLPLLHRHGDPYRQTPNTSTRVIAVIISPWPCFRFCMSPSRRPGLNFQYWLPLSLILPSSVSRISPKRKSRTVVCVSQHSFGDRIKFLHYKHLEKSWVQMNQSLVRSPFVYLHFFLSDVSSPLLSMLITCLILIFSRLTFPNPCSALPDLSNTPIAHQQA